MDLNKVLIQGRFGMDPEISETKSGGRRVRFSLAVDAGWRDDEGKWRDEVDWVDVVSFDERIVEKLEQARGLKGSKVFVDGRLRRRPYDKNGETRYGTEIRVSGRGAIDVLGK